MIGIFLKLFDSSEQGQEVSIVIPLDIPIEAAALILGDGLLPFLVEKYDVEHANEICSRIISGDYDYTLGKGFLADVNNISANKRPCASKTEVPVDEKNDNREVFKTELSEGEDWDVDDMDEEDHSSRIGSTDALLKEEEEEEEAMSPSYECEICSSSLKTKRGLQKHILKVHGEKSRFCSICSKGFKDQYDLNRHLWHAHKIESVKTVEKSQNKNFKIISKNKGTVKKDIHRLSDSSTLTAPSTHETSKHYQCELCSSVIKSRANFLQHHQRVHGEKNFKCSLCNKAFTTPYRVKCHLRHTHKIETIKKGENSKDVEDNNYILEESPNQNSEEIISKERKKEIIIAENVISQEESAPLTGKLTEENPGEDSSALASPSSEDTSKHYQCDICSSVIKSRANFLQHQQSVHGEKDFKCSLCNKAFTTPYRVKCHLRHAHKIETIRKDEKPEDEANSTNILEVSPRKNSKAVISKEHKKPSSYTCDINCGQVFSTRLLFQRHQRSTHREFFCTLCVKAFLTSHTCHRPHKCEVCGRGFNSRNVLKKHLLIHTGERPHVCESCGKSFTQVSVLQKHQIIHKTRQILACDQCDATFIDEYAFENHKVLHTGEVSHVCEVCNKTFVSKASLRQHRKLHSKVTFECEVCTKSFHHRHKLNVHMAVHSGVRSHVCEICSTAFFLRGGLLRHLQKVHGETGSVCRICKTSFPSRIHLKRHMLSHES